MKSFADPELVRQGCDLERSVSAYRASGSGASALPQLPPGADRKVPGVSPTGFGTSECALSIARDGTIFFAPGFTPRGNGVLRSRDHGVSWEQLLPKLLDGKGHGREQAFMYLDPLTERLFFHTSVMRFVPPNFAGGLHLSYSDDQGESWHYVKVAEKARDWMKVYAGPPVHSHPQGYPNLVYLSAPTPISTRFWPLLAPKYQTVQRSTDGGATWSEVGRMSLNPSDVSGCSRWEWVIFGNGVVARDGTVFLGLRRGPRLAFAVSRDEGASWQVRDVPGSKLLSYRNILQVGYINGNYVIGEPLTLDQDGNLYALWPDHEDRLRLAVSRDQGESFSEPVVVSAPEVKHVRYGVMTTGPRGALAIAYYGSSDGRAYHGYVAETTNALDSAPVFVGATINPRDRAALPARLRSRLPRHVPGWRPERVLTSKVRRQWRHLRLLL
jgi:BNR/Asp-box repeat protein